MDLIDLKYLIKHHSELAFNKSKQPRDEWYYYMHVPKSGGTSLRYALYDEFGATATYPNLIDYYWKQRGAYITKRVFYQKPSAYFLENKQLLIGHYGLFPLTIREKKPRIFTVFRHPLSRVLSAINYHSVRGRRFYGLTNKEIVSACARIECSRIQESIGYDLDYYDEEKLSSIFDSIEVIAILEYLEQSISLLNHRFNWHLNMKLKRNKNKTSKIFDAHEMDQLEQMCSLDIQIYDYAKQHFLEQYSRVKL